MINDKLEHDKTYLSKRYTIALTIIAFLSILAFINMSYLINNQANDGKTIDTSGQQIMLSQKIALYAIYYQTGQLEVSIEEMRRHHEYLLSLNMSDNVKDIYFGKEVNLDEKVRSYIENAKRFRQTTDGKSLTYVLQNSQRLLVDLNKVAQAYLSEAENKTKKLKNLEIIICIATLITLLLEALFIFKPANTTIVNKTKELVNEKNYSNTVIESSKNAIIVVYKMSLIKTFNNKAETMFGYKKSDIRTLEELLKIIPKKYKSIHKKGLKYFFSKTLFKISEKTFEFDLCDRYGELFPVRASFGVVNSGEDLIVINIEDITNEKQKDTVIFKQAKFAALGEMIAIIAHQWRQPLAEISLNNVYIKKKIEQKDLHEEICKNENIIKFMSETITNFETFYKNSEGEWFSPKDSIEQALNVTEYVLRLKEIELSVDVDSDIPQIFGQKNSLSQVILSIIQNSIEKHKTSQVDETWIKMELRKSEEDIRITIEDNAGGIQIVPIEDIFKPFRTDKKIGDKSRSTGLGLYMSRLIIEEKFNGDIFAENTQNGAKFTINIPFKH
ncbi:MAG: ATP-binding protein [Campylobacteraceae bacterium]